MNEIISFHFDCLLAAITVRSTADQLDRWGSTAPLTAEACRRRSLPAYRRHNPAGLTHPPRRQRRIIQII